MKKNLLYSLAIIGVISIVLNVFFFWQHQNITSKYWENCSKVKVGMTLSEARKTIGDLKYQYWTQDDKSAEIIIAPRADGKLNYALEYDMVFAGSDNPKIYFDPKTLLVTEVSCGE